METESGRGEPVEQGRRLKTTRTIGYRAVRDQVIAGPLGPIKVDVNEPITDPFVIDMLNRTGSTLPEDFDTNST